VYGAVGCLGSAHHNAIVTDGVSDRAWSTECADVMDCAVAHEETVGFAVRAPVNANDVTLGVDAPWG
jgi:hypothetical protein